MRKLSILIFMVFLGLLSFQCVPEALPQPTYPSDLEIEAFAGGFAPWTPLYMIQIYPNESAVYSRMEPENRSTATWTHISSFNLTVDQMNVIWDAIVVNNFFSLEQNYSTPVSDGSFAVMSITANGVTHKVITENTKVVAFDSVVITINDATPGDLDLFYNAIHPQADPPSTTMVATVAPPLSADSTTVTIKDCNITVTIRIELYGPGATADVAKKVEEDIEKYWNEGNPHVQCVCTCPIKEPGCSVTFDAVVKIRKETDPPTENYHQIRVVNDATAHYPFSYVNQPLPKPDGKTTGTGEWMDNAAEKVYAHEAGHLMGEADQYLRDAGKDGKLFTKDDTAEAKKNHDNDIMADIYKCTEVPMQDAIDRIVSAGGVICPCEECCPKPVMSAPTIDISTPIGDTYKIPISINSMQNVSSWKAGFRFDPHILECINFTEGPYLSDVGTTTWTSGTVDNVNGIVTSHNCTLEAGKSQSGTGVLAYVTFRVKNYGKTAIDLTDEDGDPSECMVLDPDRHEISLALVDGEVIVRMRFHSPS